MSQFSPRWLALREPADLAARSPELVAVLTRRLGSHPHVTVVDLGCGTGANLRATAPALGASQRWHLLDHDPSLLSVAHAEIRRWASRTERADPSVLDVRKDETRLSIVFECVDMHVDLESALCVGADPTLVTASALFDLTSSPFIERLADAVSGRRAVFYASLTYDGLTEITPAHAADADVLAAFHAHQRGDKGFGPALGRGAHETLRAAFVARRYRVLSAPSAWRLGAESAALIKELVRGHTTAAQEMGLDASRLADWEAHARTGFTVGHSDLLALPD